MRGAHATGLCARIGEGANCAHGRGQGEGRTVSLTTIDDAVSHGAGAFS